MRTGLTFTRPTAFDGAQAVEDDGRDNVLNCICGAKPPSLPPLAKNTPIVHDKAYLREHYPKRAVDGIDYHRGNKGRYTLGRGKHGKVKAATRAEDGHLVAIKSQDKWQWLLAKGEMELACALRLQHVIRVLDWAEGTKKSYIVMEQAQPVRIDDATPERARRQLLEIIEALRELHSHDMYHRDIGVNVRKKGNVTTKTIKNIMQAEGRCKLTDLGKTACAPPAMLRDVYARSDALGLCRVMHAFLQACDPEEAKPFHAWYMAQPHLRVEDVANYPWLQGLPRPQSIPRALGVRHGVQVLNEWITSPAMLFTGRGHPPADAIGPLHGAWAFNKRL